MRAASRGATSRSRSPQTTSVGACTRAATVHSDGPRNQLANIASPVRSTASPAHSCRPRASISAAASASRCSGAQARVAEALPHHLLGPVARGHGREAGPARRPSRPGHQGQQQPRVRHPPRVGSAVRHRRGDQRERRARARGAGRPPGARPPRPASCRAGAPGDRARPGSTAARRRARPGCSPRRERPGQPEPGQVDGDAGGPRGQQRRRGRSSWWPSRTARARRRPARRPGLLARRLPHVQGHPAGGDLASRPRPAVRIARQQRRRCRPADGPMHGPGGERAGEREWRAVGIARASPGTLARGPPTVTRTAPDTRPLVRCPEERGVDRPPSRVVGRVDVSAREGVSDAHGDAAGRVRGRAGARLRGGLERRVRASARLPAGRRADRSGHRPRPRAAPAAATPDDGHTHGERRRRDLRRPGRDRGRLHARPGVEHVPARQARRAARSRSPARTAGRSPAFDVEHDKPMHADRGAPRRRRLPAPAPRRSARTAVAHRTHPAGGRRLPGLRRLRSRPAARRWCWAPTCSRRATSPPIAVRAVAGRAGRRLPGPAGRRPGAGRPVAGLRHGQPERGGRHRPAAATSARSATWWRCAAATWPTCTCIPSADAGRPATGSGPGIAFTAEVPTAGSYRLFLDFRHAGSCTPPSSPSTPTGRSDESSRPSRATRSS